MAEPDESTSGDAVTGTVLLLCSVYGMYHGISLDRPDGWRAAPGLLPLIISTLLFALALTLVVGSMRRRGVGRVISGLRSSYVFAPGKMRNEVRPTLAAMATVALFYFGLLEFLWFEIAAFLFLFAMTHIFWAGSALRHRLWFALVTPFAFALVFQQLFDMSLPGAGTLAGYLLFELR